MLGIVPQSVGIKALPVVIVRQQSQPVADVEAGSVGVMLARAVGAVAEVTTVKAPW
jgi:hypothetical protein